MYALMASGLSLIFGSMGVKNFSHGELFMIGGYVMFYVTVVLDLPWPVGVVAAALVLLVVGMLIERTLIETLRRRAGRDWQLDAFVLKIGRAHVRTPVTNAHLVCRLLLEKKKKTSQ